MSAILARVVLLAALALCLYGSWRAAHWYAGSEIALAAPQLGEGAVEAARSAVRLSPDDPLAHWSLASLGQRSLAPDEAQRAIKEFEKAVSLSPNDFRLWVELGSARARTGDAEGSEKAFRKAVELAPHYSWPRWHLGNFLVRQGRYPEGFSELRRAAEVDPSKRGLIFDLVWYVYGGDIEAIKNIFGDSTDVRADLINFLVGREHMDEALRIWSSMSAEEKKQKKETGQALVKKLFDSRNYRAALQISRELEEGKQGAAPETGRISNGGFESPVVQNGSSLFDWRVQSVPQALAALDSTQAREGRLSLRINFNATGALDFKNVSQVIAVEPATEYRLVFFVRTSNLKTAAAPVVQVMTTGDEKLLGASEPAPDGQSDWREVSLDFKTPPNVDGIMLRIGRESCIAGEAVCPIFGVVWYDDFNLQPGSRNSGARRDGGGN